MARREPLPEPIQFGKYTLSDLIAVGRMGEVFKAKRGGVEGFEKVLVVKRIFPNLSASEDFVNTFVDEAKLTVSLSHANIIQVMDLGMQDGCYFMAMEHVAGFDLGTIRRVMQTAGVPFPLDIAVFMVSEVAKGLDYAHRRKDYNFESLNIVHRDLSPANVLISYEGEVKITDFGISRALEVVGVAAENPRRQFLYASPEQARGEMLTYRSDIFSLGLILYELVSGTHPYNDPNPRQVQQRAAEGNIQPIRQLVELPRALEQIINSSLQTDPNQRVDSAGTLYEELISYLFASGHKADNRSVSMFMQEVKKHEEELFKANININPPMEREQIEAVELDDLIEIDPEQLEVLEDDAGDLFAMVGDEEVAEQWARVEDEGPVMVPAHLPAARVQGRQAQESRFDPVPQPDAMPQRLGQLADGLHSGQGAALALLTPPMAGSGCLMDRLPARLKARGLFQVMHLVMVGDDRHLPCALGVELVRFAAGLPVGGRLRAPLQGEELASEAAAIRRLGAGGMDERVMGAALDLCGMLPASPVGRHSRQQLTEALVHSVLTGATAQNPLVILIDGVEHLDGASMELLMQVAALARQMPVLLVASGQGPGFEQILEAGDASGALFEALEDQEGGVAQAAPNSVDGMTPAERRLALALALTGQPAPLDRLEAMLAMPAHQIEAMGQSLAQRGVLRLVAPTHLYLPDSPTRAHLLGLSMGPMAVEAGHIARRIIELAHGLVPRWRSAWAPMDVRLMLHMGDPEAAIEAALAHGRRLRADGWGDVALAFMASVEGLLGGFGMGQPRGRAAMRVEATRAALDMMQLDAAQAALGGVWPLVEVTRCGALLAEARLLEARLAMALGRVDEVEGLLWASMSGAQSEGAPLTAARARLAAAGWLLHHGDLVQAQAHLERALTFFAQRPDEAPGDVLEAMALMVRLLARRGQLAHAHACLDRLHQHGLQQGGVAGQVWHGLARAELARATGDSAEALAFADEALSLAFDHALERAAVEVAEVAALAGLDAADGARIQASSQQLMDLGQRYGNERLGTLGEDLASLALVLTSTGDKSLDALQELHNVLREAQDRHHDARAQLLAHQLLFVALNHLGSGRDAEHHRREGMRFAGLFNARGMAAGLD